MIAMRHQTEAVDAIRALSTDTLNTLRPEERAHCLLVWMFGPYDVWTGVVADSNNTSLRDTVVALPLDSADILARLAAHHHRHVTPTLVKVGDWFATLTETQDDGTETVVATGQGRTTLIAALRLALALDTQSPGWQVLPAARSDRVTTPETRPPLSGATDGGTQAEA